VADGVEVVALQVRAGLLIACRYDVDGDAEIGLQTCEDLAAP
jgi:hypothetical protein